ncbi:hypothetical protein F889_02736 [Acinetobacter colistiniresistens]|uniref:DUF3325 domain-containing protein n=1 Tax=Acinetobacter colistiniresistens TaxID=280145 RepID=N9R4M5_9GAMM|nr:hypothetical protein [Acinetobacter colistiniresistens]ENX34072.1 hypothetical protein F889_02736 [Acinetobacter colistiniresistens]EPG37715.1 hypothetical protein F907_01685 [Acinetobacter colistiniresistens]TVT78960.1 hypothetical protein FPV60_15805 [Acinetobacter colistiniresistens]
MTLKLFGIMVSLLSCMSLYLSHPNQIFLKTQLNRIFFYVGLFGLFLGLGILIYALPALVAILIWLAIATLVWSFAPFIMLMNRS